MTQTRFGLESLPAKDDSTVSPPLHNQQSVSSSKHKPGTGFSSGSVKAGARSGARARAGAGARARAFAPSR